ncbi:MAG: type II toxin-antitoxin system RelE/ParE family toxin [Proteobacteria bacterium]|nr:type II toxin-antitoxin system RelE/ParE family toxin [Pseudomonadota bacterium]
MKVEFANDDLARICTDQAHRMGLPFVVIKSARNKLVQLEAAADERDLIRIRGLDYKTRKGGDNETRSIRVNDQYRIFFTLSSTGSITVATITFIGDPH